MLKNPASKYRAFAPVRLTDRTWPDAVLTAAADLVQRRPARRQPGADRADGHPTRKLRMFEQLVKIGFKEIEVGFPSASQTEFDFIRMLIEDDLIPDDVTIQVLTQAREPLIRRTFESLRGAKRVIVHLYNATAPRDAQGGAGPRRGRHRRTRDQPGPNVQGAGGEQPKTRWTFQYSPEMFSGTELPSQARRAMQ